MQNIFQKSVFNLKEAADYLGISTPTLVRLLKSDRIFYRRVGQRWLISKTTLDTWLNNTNEKEGETQ